MQIFRFHNRFEPVQKLCGYKKTECSFSSLLENLQLTVVRASRFFETSMHKFNRKKVKYLSLLSTNVFAFSLFRFLIVPYRFISFCFQMAQHISDKELNAWMNSYEEPQNMST